MNSTLPIIINEIKTNFEKLLIDWKSKFARLNKLELTVFIIVKIPNLIEFSKSISEIDKSEEIIVREIKNIIIDKKYLFMTL